MIEISGEIDGVGGSFKKSGYHSHEVAPCKHLVIYKERLVRKDKIILIHGNDDGVVSVTSEVVDQ
ncbi:hypothetical protein IBTHAUMO2_240112 [Nitrosopumilaceae archaeon]|nr:hypothetical protein IBTHAUMO2_240112 [Nitrosopumilaceae archaeon]